MYNKDLTEQVRLRLSKKDFDFLVFESLKCDMSVSEILRYIITKERIKYECEDDVHGDTKTNIDNII